MIAIQNAKRMHIPDLARIIRDSNQDVAQRFHLTAANAPKHPSNCTASWVQSAMDQGVRYFLLRAHNRFCGCVALEQAQATLFYLERLAVLPDDRRQGFGRALVRHAVNEAALAGCRRLGIGLIAEHAELRNWYAKLGFVEDDTKRFVHLPFHVTFMHLTVEKPTNRPC